MWHKENRYAGRSDIALNEKGYAQADQLATWAATAGITGIWSSTLSRACNTASPIAKALGLPLQTDARLVELDFGRGEGLTSAEMSYQMPEEFAAFRVDPVKNFLPEGEDPVHAVERALAAFYEVAECTDSGGRALVVAHNTLLRLVLCRLLGISLSRYRTVFPVFDNCSLTEIEMAPGVASSLLCFNVPLSIPPQNVNQ
jgi:probable phosphoglycerate mutase